MQSWNIYSVITQGSWDYGNWILLVAFCSDIMENFQLVSVTIYLFDIQNILKTISSKLKSHGQILPLNKIC